MPSITWPFAFSFSLLTGLISCNMRTMQWSRYGHIYVIDKVRETERVKMTLPSSQSWKMIESDHELVINPKPISYSLLSLCNLRRNH